MTRGRKKLAWRIAASLAAGVVLTVGVAWGVLLCLNPPRFGVSQNRAWAVEPPVDWRTVPDGTSSRRSLGMVQVRQWSEVPYGRMASLRTGLPMLAVGSHWFRSETQHEYRGGVVPPSMLRDRLKNNVNEDALPIAILWPGFALNTIFYAGIVLLLWSAPGFVRRRRRLRRGQCPACGYDLRATPGKPCPECGS